MTQSVVVECRERGAHPFDVARGLRELLVGLFVRVRVRVRVRVVVLVLVLVRLVVCFVGEGCVVVGTFVDRRVRFLAWHPASFAQKCW